MASIAPWINDPSQMSPSLNLGLSLLANSNTPGGFGSIFGRSALQAGQNSQQAQLVQQQIEQAKLQQQMMRAQQGFLQDYANPPQSNQPPQQDQAPQQPQQDQEFRPGISKMPDGGLLADAAPTLQPTAPQSPAPQSQTPSWLTPPTAADISSIPIAGKSPQQIAAYDAYILKKDPLQTQKEIREQQFQLVQQQYAQKMTTMDNLIRTAQPSAAMKADPQLMAAWPQLAAQAGIDPSQYNDANVRTALTFARNKVASGIGLPAIESKSSVEWKDAGDKLIPVYNNTGERVPGLSPISKGLTPEQSRDSKNFSDEASSLLASLAAQGVSLPAGLRSKEQQIATLNGLVKKYPDKSPDEIAGLIKTGQLDFAGNKKATLDFTTGKAGNTVRSLNVAVQHLNTLDGLSDALNNGNLTLLNKAANVWKTQTGQTGPTNFEAAKKIVADEVVKAIVGSGGGVADREEAAKTINAASSPPQLKGVIAQYKQLMAGQLEGLRQQYKASTGKDDFDEKFLMDATKKELEGKGAHPTNIQALMDKYK